jgi:A/G-specific adenine glycosylase
LVTTKTLRKIVEGIEEWSKVSGNYRRFPWREDPDPYRVLVAELLLRRTTAAAVSRVYNDFLRTFPNLESLVGSDTKEIESKLKTLGYQKLRATIFKEVASAMILNFDGIPASLEELQSVKNIGLYTSAAIVCLGYCKPMPMVDTNITRVLSRIIAKKISQRSAFEILVKVLPEDFKRFNLSMLDFSALICRYGTPSCYMCPIANKCSYEPKTPAPRAYRQ